LSKDLGPEEIPHLEALKRTEDPLMASKAVYLSSLISHNRSIDLLKDAADDPRPEVRIAAASGSANFVNMASMRDTLSSVNVSGIEEVLNKLRNDSDAGVSKVARKSLGSVADLTSK
jgi:HEAT repeat protein